MPISGDEFESGTVEDDADGETPLESEKDLIVTFLSEHHDSAFTEREIVLGVDFSSLVAETSTPRFGAALVDTVSDLVGEATATVVVVDDVDEALAELVEEGTVETREVETEGGTETYYRLAE